MYKVNLQFYSSTGKWKYDDWWHIQEEMELSSIWRLVETCDNFNLNNMTSIAPTEWLEAGGYIVVQSVEGHPFNHPHLILPTKIHVHFRR